MKLSDDKLILKVLFSQSFQDSLELSILDFDKLKETLWLNTNFVHLLNKLKNFLVK